MEWLIIFVGGVCISGAVLRTWPDIIGFGIGLTAVIYGVALVWGIG